MYPMCKWCGRNRENVTVRSKAAKNENRSIWCFIFPERLAEHAYTIFIYFVYNTTLDDDSRSTWYVCERINGATRYVEMGYFVFRFYIFSIYLCECVLKVQALIGIDAIVTESIEKILFASLLSHWMVWEPIFTFQNSFFLSYVLISEEMIIFLLLIRSTHSY